MGDDPAAEPFDQPASAPVAPPERAGWAQRLGRRRHELLARVDDGVRRLEGARGRSAAVDGAWRAVERDVSAGGGVLAGAVAFRVFLYLVPFVFVLVVGLGVGAEAADRDPQDVARDAGASGLIAQAIGGVSEASLSRRLATLAVALVALVLGARALVKVLWVVSALIWGVPPGKPRSTVRAIGVLLGLTLVAIAISGLTGEVRANTFVGGVALTVLFALAVPGGLWLLASWLLPHGDAPWTALVPGAVMVGLGAAAMQLVTVYWVSYQVSAKFDTYGAIGTALALLVWAYLLGRLVTAATSLNASFWARAQSVGGPGG